MKNFKFFLPFAALGLLASCSNDNIGDQPNPDPTPTNGKAYLHLSLAMPSNSASGRADTNPEDAKGEENEYAFKDGKLFLYNISESDAEVTTCAAIVDITGPFTDGDDGEITSYSISNQVIPIPDGIDTNKDYYALVILNTKALKSLPYIGQAYNAWNEVAQDKISYKDQNKDYFAMTNALGFDKNATTKTPSILVKLPKEYFYYESETNTNVLTIYVNRLTAKVSLDQEAAIKVGGDAVAVKATDRDNVNGDKVSLDSWYLVFVNGTTYPVQKLEGTTPDNWATSLLDGTWPGTDNLARFTRGTDFTRVNWCVDVNYDGNNGLSSATFGTAATGNEAYKAVFYPMENTFNVSNMKQNCSTTAVFTATYYRKPTGDPTAATAKSFLVYNGKIYDVTNEDNVLAETTGQYNLKSALSGDDLTAACEAYGIDSENDTTMVDVYVKGACYYTAIIRHFNDSELDIENDGSTWTLRSDGYSNDKDYGGDNTDKNFLGRYGIVRNNWYVLNPHSISGPGKTTPPGDDDDDWDDDEEGKLFDVSINILSWTKRSQDLDW